MNNTIPCVQMITTNSRLGVKSKRKKHGEFGNSRDGGMETRKGTVLGAVLARVPSIVKMKSAHTKKVQTSYMLGIAGVLMWFA